MDGAPTGFYKIGKGRQFLNMRYKNTMNPRPLNVLYNIILTPKLDNQWEARLHDMFHIYRIPGSEWFHNFNKTHPEYFGVFEGLRDSIVKKKETIEKYKTEFIRSDLL